MKNKTRVRIHHEMVEAPIEAEAASVSMTIIAQTVKRVISRVFRTFLKPFCFVAVILKLSLFEDGTMNDRP
jgi:hypothetical protein